MIPYITEVNYIKEYIHYIIFTLHEILQHIVAPFLTRMTFPYPFLTILNQSIAKPNTLLQKKNFFAILKSLFFLREMRNMLTISTAPDILSHEGETENSSPKIILQLGDTQILYHFRNNELILSLNQTLTKVTRKTAIFLSLKH